MAKRRIPMRKCVATDEMKPKKEMVRIVRNKEKEIFIDETGKKNGRGAYISLDPQAVVEAKKNKSLDQALKVKVSDDFYDELSDYTKYRLARIEIMRQNEA